MERLTEKQIENLKNVIREMSDTDKIPFTKKAIEAIVDSLTELKKYKDAEEQGLLLRLPCKVGDTLWNIKNKRTEPFVVKEFKICAYKINRIEIYFENTTRGFGVCLFDGTLDESWYRTKAEAEAKLKEME